MVQQNINNMKVTEFVKEMADKSGHIETRNGTVDWVFEKEVGRQQKRDI